MHTYNNVSDRILNKTFNTYVFLANNIHEIVI